MRYAFLIDQSRCIGCHACSLACKSEHEVPLGSYRTWVKYVEKGFFPDVRRTFSVLRCNHCENPPCVEICPVTALFQRDDGIVDFDREVCIGCKACMQACPYDALYIHPDRNTAEKCNFCAHRIEIQLEPPCATVCPAEAILVGDLDDPSSRVTQLVATEKVDVRKPEKGTIPKVFYIEAEPRALTPGASDPSGGYMWADRGSSSMSLPVRPSRAAYAPVPGDEEESASGPAVSPSPKRDHAVGPDAWMATDMPPAAAAQALAAAAMRGEADFYTGVWAGLSPARTVYDVAHKETPWGAHVSAYLWTKSIAAGGFVIAALAPWLGLAGSSRLTLGAPLLGLLFLAITSFFLIVDLKRPERFWTILVRPNWDSWLARGAFIITAFGLLATIWTASVILEMSGGPRPPDWVISLLRWPLVATALATAGYSGYLFAQAKARDFWQNPMLPLHLVVQCVAAGAAASLGLMAFGGDAAALGTTLVVALGVHLSLIFFGEVTVAHATVDAAKATRAMTRGEYAGWFWSGVVLALLAITSVLAFGPSGGAGAFSALAALVGLLAYEHAWNYAGQAPPLS
jgi:Fe-S-cluster-containing dehydrogenase component/formate-dependent nitrite reductase membrane component NrfD